MHKEENSWQGMYLGAPGTGKSLSAGSTLLAISPKQMDVDHVVFKAKPFLKLVKHAKPGTPILCDEIGSWLSSRDWMTLQNKLMSIVLETYRYKRLAVIWTVPHMRMVDLNLRDLCHAIGETVAINREHQYCEMKFKYRTVNPMTGKGYEKFPVINQGGTMRTVTRVRVARPPKSFEIPYEKKKRKHLETVYDNILNEIDRIEKNPQPHTKRDLKRFKIIRDLKEGKLKVSEIAKKHKSNTDYVYKIRRSMP
jgi:hypothetical protein